MKICSCCKKNKSEESYSFRDIKKGIRHNRCKECSRSLDNELYKKSIERRNKVKKNRWSVIKRNQEFILNYLLYNPCKDCGFNNPVCLDFDHVVDNKIEEVGLMARQGVSLARLKEEIEKCEVRCANCHRIKTASTFGSYKNTANLAKVVTASL